MSRPLRYDYPGAVHHIIVRGNNRAPVLLDNSDKAYLILCLIDILSKVGGFLHGFAILDNHFHLLYETGKISMSKFMQRLNTKYAAYFKKKYGFVGHVFQGRYKSILIEPGDEKYYFTVLRYIVRNPFVAGICDNIVKYKYTSLKSYFEPKQYTFIKNDIVKSRYANFNNFLKYILSSEVTEEDKVLYSRIKDFYFLGSNDFIEEKIKSAQKEMRKMDRTGNENITAANVEAFILQEFNLSFKELHSRTKNKNISNARRIAAYLLANRVHFNYAQIQQRLGYSNSGDVSYNIKRVESDAGLMGFIRKFDRIQESRV